MLPKLEDVKVAVIGLPYVGLALAVHLGREVPTVGFDINTDDPARLARC